MSKKLRIKLIRSPIGCKKDQKATLIALKLRKIGDEVVKEDNSAIRGMINKVQHLISVEEENA